MNFFRCLSLLAVSLILFPALCRAQDDKFDGLDTDSDGKVTKEEFKEYAKFRLSNLDLLNDFTDRVDADKDGSISKAEFDRRVEVMEALNKDLRAGGVTQKKRTKEEVQNIDAAIKAFNEIEKLVSKGNWEEAAEKMTKQGSDEFVIGMVVQGIGITGLELPPQLDNPTVNNVRDATKAVLERYDLADIDISSLLGKKGSQDPSNTDDEEAPREGAKARQKEIKIQRDKTKAEIIAAVDKKDQRWDIIDALRDAQMGSPFNQGVFVGKIAGSSIDGKVVFLTVNRSAPGQKVALPTVVKMIAEENEWKYAGRDLLRTKKAMQQMVRSLRKKAAPSEPDTDF